MDVPHPYPNPGQSIHPAAAGSISLQAIRKIENLHIGLWLLKDISWCSDWHWVGMLAAVPTLVVAFYLTWQLRAEAAELVHNLAVCLWIIANIVWMTGEFYYNDGTRPISKVFFFAGMAVLLAYYGREAFQHVRARVRAGWVSA